MDDVRVDRHDPDRRGEPGLRIEIRVSGFGDVGITQIERDKRVAAAVVALAVKQVIDRDDNVRAADPTRRNDDRLGIAVLNIKRDHGFAGTLVGHRIEIGRHGEQLSTLERFASQAALHAEELGLA